MRAAAYHLVRLFGRVLWWLHKLLDWPSRRLARASVRVMIWAQRIGGDRRHVDTGRSTMRGG